MTRGGRVRMRDDEEPERRCIVTRKTRPKRELLRFVVGPDGVLVPDMAGKLPGRGIWVSADRKALEKAVAKGLFARAAREPVRVPSDLVARVEALVLRLLVERIALARKAGEAVAGREKTLDALRSGTAALLLQASDGSQREAAGLRPPAGEETRITCLSAEELGMAFGRDRVIHAAVLAGGLADRTILEALRLSGIRGPGDRQKFGAALANAGRGNASVGKAETE